MARALLRAPWILIVKITFLVPLVSMSGGTRVIAKYCELLQQRGHDVVLISAPQRTTTLRVRLRKLLLTGKWQSAAHHRPSHIDGLAVDYRVLARRPPRNDDIPDADVLIATWWETAEWAASLGDAKGAKVYFVQDHEIFDFLPVHRARATYRLPLHKIVVSKWLSDLMASSYDDPCHDLVPNSIDLVQFRTDERGKQSQPTFGFLYTPAPRKSVRICIEAIEQAREIIPELRVLSFGVKPPESSLPLPSWVEFYHQPDQAKIARLYSGCDAWLFTSESEGFGLPLLEAMASRTPVIATPAGAAPELMASGGGIMVPVGDSQAIVEAMRRIHMMSDGDWRALSLRAHDSVAHYGWDAAADAFESALLNAIDRAERNEVAGGKTVVKVS